MNRIAMRARSSVFMEKHDLCRFWEAVEGGVGISVCSGIVVCAVQLK